MNPARWKDVEQQLRGAAPSVTPRDAEAFWSDFKARAALVRQESPAPATNRFPVVLRWSAVTALALILMITGFFALPLHPAITQIKSLEVVAPHSGVIIMNDGSGRGTILWITGMEAKQNSG